MSRWTDELLHSKRQVMDPLADDTVRALFEKHGLGILRAFHDELVDADGRPKDGLPDALVRYLEATAVPPDFLDPAKVALGESVLASHGILIFLLLTCASLPECYADRLGMPVLFLTQKLNQDIGRRCAETSKYVVDVLSSHGFSLTGRALDSTRKVRLMHAAVRYLILHTDRETLAAGLPPDVAKHFLECNWQEELGQPINQEDLAYTLQTFSWVSIRGMRDLHACLTPEEEDAISHCWNVAGHYLGIDHDLLPASVEEGRELFEAIKVRVAGESEEGKSLTAAVMNFAENRIKFRHFKALPQVLTRYVVGNDTADMLGLPTPKAHERFDELAWTKELGFLVHFTEERLRRLKGLRALAAKGFELVIGSFLDVETDKGGTVPFEIPESLAPNWKVEHLEPLS